QRPEDLVVTTHVCRGNFKSTYAVSGSYEEIAEFLFAKEEVDGYFLEFDDERSGGFEPLRKVTGDKKVVLGLITSKRPELEDKDRIIARIHEAAQYIPLERLSLSPQCGFASTEEGNKLTQEDQWKKLQLVKEIADEVWS
ncbi:MAG TPA: 5-methyltetrahydropteroyltriglutamate--homocysteine methyltransferase, partial [Globicatella sulfidifaciens]|nr:5-methyltetrahydropteroyltriglutamate--homocysteine methyltransferase [Globicatella sulfidifaciens]